MDTTTPQLAPIGTILAYAGQNIDALEDAGWMICDGRSLPRAYYADLFNAIGANFGARDSSSFNLPMLQGMFLRGVSDDKPSSDPDVSLRSALKPGGNTGASVGSYQTYGTAPAKKPFKANIPNSGIGDRSRDVGCQTPGAKYESREDSYQASQGGDAETRPINKYVYYIIKYRALDKQREYVKIPIGAIVPFAGSVATGLDSRWLLCDGRGLNTTQYAALFGFLGFAHGKKSDTEFVLPDYRGYFLRGVDGGANVDPDRAKRTAPYIPQGGPASGNTGDAVGSAQPWATALPIKAGFKTTFKNLPQSATDKAIDGVIKTIFQYNADGVWVDVTQSDGDLETCPPNVNVDWYIRFQ